MFDFLKNLGWPIWLLVITSLVTVAVIAERFLSLRRIKVIPTTLMNDVLTQHRSGQFEQPEKLRQLENNSPLGRVLAAAVRYRSASREIAKEAIEESGRVAIHELERFLAVLSTIVTAAPLLGLFGTVYGMIKMFHGQSPTGINPQMLQEGIADALFNTAFGIAIAVITLFFYRYFRSVVDAYIVELEQKAIRFVDALHPPTNR